MQLATLKTVDKIQKLSDANPHKAIRSCKLFLLFLKWRLKTIFVAVAFWVDASDVGQQPGQFVWQSDGSKVDAANWGPGNPDDFGAGKKACVYLSTYNAKLGDSPCIYAGWAFVCELAEQDLPC